MAAVSRPRVVFVTSKYWRATSKVGFHFLARSFARGGWDVLFVTAPVTRIGAWLGTSRVFRQAIHEANRVVVADGVASYVWTTPWHPVNLRLGVLNRAAGPLYRRYGDLALGVEDVVAGAQRMIFDSGADLLLFSRFKRLSPRAAFVYRVSDDLRHSGVHPVVLEAEEAVAPDFDLISVPCRYIEERFRSLARVTLQHHGVDEALFDRDHPDPYAGAPRPRALFVGQHALDTRFLDVASALFPDWSFHVIGPFARLPRRHNVQAYGERPFADTVAFIKHADVGLHTIAWSPGAEAFTDSLKVIQYTYCRLPIVAPAFLESRRANLFTYVPGNRGSIAGALARARDFDRAGLDTSPVRSWDDLADDLGRSGAS